MSELNVLVVTGLELKRDRQNGDRINMLLVEEKYVEAGVDTIPVKRPLFDPAKSTFSSKTESWYRKALEILGQQDVTDNVQFNGKPWKVEGFVGEIKLAPHHFKDATGKYVTDRDGQKVVIGEFKTAVFGFETLEGVTEGFRRRVDANDWVKSTDDIPE